MLGFERAFIWPAAVDMGRSGARRNCLFALMQIVFGQALDHDGVSTDPCSRRKARTNEPLLIESVRSVRAFVGAVGIARCHILREK